MKFLSATGDRIVTTLAVAGALAAAPVLAAPAQAAGPGDPGCVPDVLTMECAPAENEVPAAPSPGSGAEQGPGQPGQPRLPQQQQQPGGPAAPPAG